MSLSEILLNAPYDSPSTHQHHYSLGARQLRVTDLCVGSSGKVFGDFTINGKLTVNNQILDPLQLDNKKLIKEIDTLRTEIETIKICNAEFAHQLTEVIATLKTEIDTVKTNHAMLAERLNTEIEGHKIILTDITQQFVDEQQKISNWLKK